MSSTRDLLSEVVELLEAIPSLGCLLGQTVMICPDVVQRLPDDTSFLDTVKIM